LVNSTIELTTWVVNGRDALLVEFTDCL